MVKVYIEQVIDGNTTVEKIVDFATYLDFEEAKVIAIKRWICKRSTYARIETGLHKGLKLTVSGSADHEYWTIIS